MMPAIEKISAITLRIMNMKAWVQFYRDVLGMKLLYGGESPAVGNVAERARVLSNNTY
jgi:catechol 2,3-dioxygenase-like lactoylglutathione lyase family enzyme